MLSALAVLKPLILEFMRIDLDANACAIVILGGVLIWSQLLIEVIR